MGKNEKILEKQNLLTEKIENFNSLVLVMKLKQLKIFPQRNPQGQVISLVNFIKHLGKNNIKPTQLSQRIEKERIVSNALSFFEQSQHEELDFKT